MIIKDMPIRDPRHESLSNLTSYLMKGKDRRAVRHARVSSEFTVNTAALLPEDAVLEMQLTAKANTNKKLTGSRFVHLMVSLRGREHLTQEKWQELSRDLLKSLDLASHQAYGVVHRDTDNEHLHLVINRIHPETLKAAKLSFLHRKLQNICTELEQKFQLQTDNHQQVNTPEERRAKDIEVKTGQESFYSYLLPLKDRLLEAASWREFHQILATCGVKAESTGRGMVFATERDGTKFVLKASSLDRRLSLAKCESRLGRFTVPEGLDEVEQLARYEQLPVTFNTEDDDQKEEKDRLFRLYKEEKAKSLKERSFILSQLRSEKRSELKKLNLERSRYSRALKIVYPDQQKRAAEKLKFDALYAGKKASIEQAFNAQISETLNRYPKISFLDWLRSREKDPESRELLMTRDGAGEQGSVNEIYAQLYLEINRTELTAFQFYKRTGKGSDLLISPFTQDVIRDNGSKFVLDRHPSLLAVTEVLRLAVQRFGTESPLIINGTHEFQHQCAAVAAQMQIRITCTSGDCQRYFEKLSEDHYERRTLKPGRRYFTGDRTGSGGTSIHRADTFRTLGYKSVILRSRSRRTEFTGADEAQPGAQREKTARQDDLPQMPLGSLDAVSNRGQALLQPDAHDRMGEQRSSALSDRVRRPLHGASGTEERRGVKSAADYIRERNLKRKTIRDIPEHRLFTGQNGKFEFQGLRELGGKHYALLKQNGIVYVRELNDYGRRRLEKLRRKSTVTVRRDGVMEVSASQKSSARRKYRR